MKCSFTITLAFCRYFCYQYQVRRQMGRNKIKELRDKAGLTQKALADSVGISTRALISLEAKKDLVNKHLPMISAATGFSEVELLGYELPSDVETATRQLREACDLRYKRAVDDYEDKLSKQREKISLLEGTVKSQKKTINSLEKVVRMLENQLCRYEKAETPPELSSESHESTPTEQEIS